ncbi:MAG: SURF1 family cytochrome oxidase biogenesis protein, partial [Pseudomonadota bacterium]
AHKIPNNHLSYAVTWFLLALVWAVMTAIWIRGELRRPRPA